MLIQELGRRLPGSTMSRETWRSLTKITQSKWDEIPDKEKKAILEDGSKRKDKKAEVRSVEHVQTDEEERHANQEDTQGEYELEVNETKISKGETHPGDVRCMMSKPSQPKAKVGAQIKFTSLKGSADEGYTTHMVDSYWSGRYSDDDDESDEDFQ
jgi:hypothetical protein